MTQAQEKEPSHILNLFWQCEPDFQALWSSQATMSEEQMGQAVVRYYKHFENGSTKPSGLWSDSRREGEKTTTWFWAIPAGGKHHQVLKGKLGVLGAVWGGLCLLDNLTSIFCLTPIRLEETWAKSFSRSNFAKAGCSLETPKMIYSHNTCRINSNSSSWYGSAPQYHLTLSSQHDSPALPF